MEQASVYKERGFWLRLTSNASAVLDCWWYRVSLEPSATYNLVQVTLVAPEGTQRQSSIGISTGGTSVQEQPVSH